MSMLNFGMLFAWLAAREGVYFSIGGVVNEVAHDGAADDSWMVQYTPFTWVICRVKCYLWHQ